MLHYDSLSPYPIFVARFSDIEPKSYAQAVRDPRWVETMEVEIKALEDNQTLEVVALPPGKRAIGCKWVYKIKYKANGEVWKVQSQISIKGV